MFIITFCSFYVILGTPEIKAKQKGCNTMKIFENNTRLIPEDTVNAWARRLPQGIIFVDIETTGLSSAKDPIYCIGTARIRDNVFNIRQFFAEQTADEPVILNQFLEMLNEQKNAHILTFNGNTFDLPYIEKRCKKYALSFQRSDWHLIDLYREARELKVLLGLTGLKQKNIEDFLGIYRKDIYSGGELTDVYRQYEKSQDQQLQSILLQHNLDDIRGMVSLLPLRSYRQLLKGGFQITDIRLEKDADIHGREIFYAAFNLSWAIPLPKRVSRILSGIQILLHETEGLLRIPVQKATLKYYFKDYKNYYYLPEEDTAVHKSIGQFVDKAHKTAATKETCYLKKTGIFIPMPKPGPLPCFQTDYKSKEYFAEFDPLLLFQKNRSACIQILSDYMRNLKP